MSVLYHTRDYHTPESLVLGIHEIPFTLVHALVRLE